MTLKIRRGTNAERLTITPEEGELIFTTDTKKVFIGDGNTAGGLVVSDTGNTNVAANGTSTNTSFLNFINTASIAVSVTANGTGYTNVAFTTLGGVGDAYNQANTARGTANDSYGQANAARDQANTARTQANTARNTANASYAAVNTAFDQANTARDTANNAYAAANAAGGGSGAYDQANTARNQANSARDQANTARTTANDAYGAANNRVLKAGDTMTGNLNIAATLITQNIVPNLNVTYNIGANDFRFNDLWLSNSTIYIGGASISSNADEVRISKLNVANLLTASGINVSAQAADAYTQANNAYAAANAAGGAGVANAYNQANSARDQANTAYTQANNARNQANNAYESANTGKDTVRVSQNNQGILSEKQLNFVNTSTVTVSITDSGNGNANIAFTATGGGAAAYDQANSARDQANTARTTGNNAYGQANTARDTANAAYAAANSASGAEAANLVAVYANNSLVYANSNVNFNNTATINISVTANTTNKRSNIAFNANTTNLGATIIYSQNSYSDWSPGIAGAISNSATSTNRTFESRLREYVSVGDFGAVGDGVTDDTAAIQKALNFCRQVAAYNYNPNSGVAVPKTYQWPTLVLTGKHRVDQRQLFIDRPIDAPLDAGSSRYINYFTIMGLGDCAGFVLDDDGEATRTGPLFTSSIAGTNVTGTIIFENVHFEADNPGDAVGTPAAILDSKYLRVKFNRCWFDGVRLIDHSSYIQSIHFFQCRFSAPYKNSTYPVIRSKGIFDMIIDSCMINNTDTFMRVLDGAYDVNNLRIVNCDIEGLTTNSAFQLHACSGLVVDGNYFENDTVPIFDFSGVGVSGSRPSNSITFKGNWIYTNLGGPFAKFGNSANVTKQVSSIGNFFLDRTGAGGSGLDTMYANTSNVQNFITMGDFHSSGQHYITDSTRGIYMSANNNYELGIGIKLPTANLHVVGNANISVSINTATLNATTINAATVLTSTGINVSAAALNAYAAANTKVGGSGTTNYLARFTASSTVGDSVVRDDGSFTGIGIAPQAGQRLAVSGNNQSSGAYAAYFYDSNGLPIAAFENDRQIYAPALGTGTGTDLVVTSGGYIKQKSSSLRFKKDVEPIDIGLDWVNSLQPVKYKLKADEKDEVGFIAEDFPDQRFVSQAYIDVDDHSRGLQPQAINYAQIVAPLVKAVQELTLRVQQLENNANN
jgi:hypothetical protein